MTARLLKPHEVVADLEKRTDWSAARGYTPEQRQAALQRMRQKYPAPTPTAAQSEPSATSATPPPTFLDSSALPLIDDGTRPKSPEQIAAERARTSPADVLSNYISNHPSK